MRLIDILRAQAAGELSYFQSYLLREDIGRLEKVVAEVPKHSELASFLAAAVKFGWTAENRRTADIEAPLAAVLTAIYAHLNSTPPTPPDDEIMRLWKAFDRHRIDRLAGCLARVPTQ
jgi:hypothetical protein